MKYFYHKDIKDLKKIKYQKDKILIFKSFSGNESIHPKNSGPVCSLFFINGNEIHLVNHIHDEFYKIEYKEFMDHFHTHSKEIKHKFVLDLKKHLHFSESFLGKYYNDFDVFFFNKTSDKSEREDLNLNSHYFKDKYSNGLNLIIPISKLIQNFREEISNYTRFDLFGELYEPGYRSLVDRIIPFLYNIEKHGIYCDKESFKKFFGTDKEKFLNGEYIYTNYNIFSQTGRPSNALYNINFSALNKDNGERSFITSRYGKSGTLILFDFKAYHPHLLSSLINYKFPKFDDFYIWITDQMKEHAKGSPDNLKGEVFTQIYGKIEEKYLKIDYFKKLNDFIKQRWKYFQENGYVDTPIFKRSIKDCHINSPFPNKVTNYLLQAYETERNCLVMEYVNSYLLDKNKKTVPIKYDYDGILFDFHKDDGIEVVKEIKNLLESDGFPVTIKIGKDFDKMVKMKI